MPGQGSDAPGLVVLVDTHRASVSRLGRIEMVQMMESPTWGAQVDVPRVATWELPCSEAPTQGLSIQALYYADGEISHRQRADGSFEE